MIVELELVIGTRQRLSRLSQDINISIDGKTLLLAGAPVPGRV
jgi:hypothetical protein